STVNPEKVDRYLVPNLRAINLVLNGFLEGGASEGLIIDKQGKTVAAHMRNKIKTSIDEAFLV
ncbi:MAG TPA: hypothetical protein VI564_06660, partial [Candidatus Nanoarchaeia archaeon]|nr:hypothetical protein [Candidatus Nanoarchaeia archaeon]